MGGGRSWRWSACAVLLVVGACTTTPREQLDRATHPIREGRIDVGGYQLAYRCLGSGATTVVTEAGYDASGLEAFGPLLEAWSADGRACAYDRAGIGSSDARPETAGLTSQDQATELHRLLGGAGIEPPYLLVAHSYGGFVSRLFAATYPAETAGLILLESSHEDEIDAYRDLYGVDSPDAEWIDGGDLLDIDATERALREEARSFGPMPLIVIRADRYEDVLREALWRRTQADLATISDDGVFAIARDSGHFLLLDAPGVVGTAVTAVVTAIDTGAPLPGCREVFAGLAVRCRG